MANLLIPCSGPGTRSTGYTKFHKALIRIGNMAVIDHIIQSYVDIDTIYITLGYKAEIVREYIEHAGYKNVEFINIPDWNNNQITSFQQIQEHVFRESLYYNACDNWTTTVPEPLGNTYYTCMPSDSQHYDSSNGAVYSGIAYIKDAQYFYELLQNSQLTRNDLLLYQKFDQLTAMPLNDWFDVGNKDSYIISSEQFNDDFNILDKSNQEFYKINSRVVKLFQEIPTINFNSLAFPHPQPVRKSSHGISYDFVEGAVNPVNGCYTYLLDTLVRLWEFSLNNNQQIYDTTLWRDKTWDRFNQMLEQNPKFAGTIEINGKTIDPVRIMETLPWSLICSGIQGPAHGDLVLDNIIVADDKIVYIDHRPGVVTDVFYDICKFYHSLYLHNTNLKSSWRLTNTNVQYTIDLELLHNDNERIKSFHDTELYKCNKLKIELCVGCIWLSMAPLNVDTELNKFLFLLAMEKFNEQL